MKQQAHRQHGSTLLVAMIFLVLISLFGIGAYKSSTSHLRVVGNMQARQEAIAVAQQAIEQTISSDLFIANPAEVANLSLAVDMNNDMETDYTASLQPAPQCIRSRVLKNNEYEFPEDPATTPDSDDLVCINGSGSGGDSDCAQTEWNISAEVVDARTGARVSVHQGVNVRMRVADADSLCQP